MGVTGALVDGRLHLELTLDPVGALLDIRDCLYWLVVKDLTLSNR